MGGWALTFKNLLFPVFCKECGLRLLTEENGYYCPQCWDLIERIEMPYCAICGKPHPKIVGGPLEQRYLCGDCAAVPEDRPYRMLRGAVCYSGVAADAIKLFKFDDRPRLAGPLGELALEFAERELDCAGYDYLVPVPLHRVRERARGFNQARLLVRTMLPAFPNSTVDENLKRIRPTRVQSRLTDPKERQANVAGAFSISEAPHLKDRTVLLVDDVVTTSVTVSECAAVLRGAGAATVDVLAVALAVGSDEPEPNRRKRVRRAKKKTKTGKTP
jgi:ComF family protein